MNSSVVHVGLDVHKKSIHAVCINPVTQEAELSMRIGPCHEDVLKYLAGCREHYGAGLEIVCAYEAGCMGFGLRRFLEGNAIRCVVMAPSTMMSAPTRSVKKTDARDAETIARNLAVGAFSEVGVPTPEDEAVRDHIRMRDDFELSLKKVRQRIGAFRTRNGKWFTETRSTWTRKHREWLRGLEPGPVAREALDEYLLEHSHLEEKIARLDRRIEEIAAQEEYKEKASRLACLKGVTVRQALALLVEIGDFARFPTASSLAAWIGLLPGERSSGDTHRSMGISKAGNQHLRRMLIESAGCFQRGKAGQKSVALRKRQEGQPADVVEHADRASERLRRKCQKMILKGRPRNVAVTACAREMACFVWAIATGHLASALDTLDADAGSDAAPRS